MTPIINPLWFYLIGISENIACTFWIVGGILLFIGIAAGIVTIVESEDMEENHLKNLFKTIKQICILGIMLIMIGNLTPSKDTCYKMMTATLVTPNNITAVGEAATDVVDYIVDSVDRLLEEDEVEEEHE